MGHKVNPRILRATTTFTHPSRWYASYGKQQYAHNLQTDTQIRQLIRQMFRDAFVSLIEIERAQGEIIIYIHTAKPGVVIGRGGTLIEDLKKEIKRRFFGSEKIKIIVNINEVRDADMNAELVQQSIRDQIEKRVPFRRALKRTMERVRQNSEVKGCRLQVGGRLNGVEIARTEALSEGRLPLHTLRANIDYSRGIARTTYGVIGIKVWIYKGDVFGDLAQQPQEVKRQRKARQLRRRPSHRKKIETGGKKLILRKKADVDKEKISIDTIQ